MITKHTFIVCRAVFFSYARHNLIPTLIKKIYIYENHKETVKNVLKGYTYLQTSEKLNSKIHETMSNKTISSVKSNNSNDEKYDQL